MYDRILIPTDGSKGTKSAMTHAFEHARQYDAEIHVLYVLDTRSMVGSPTGGYSLQEWSDEEERAADSAIESVVEQAPEAVDTVEIRRSGIPANQIVKYANDEDIELVVMGTHGRSGIGRYLIGSVAEKVVRQSEAPVLTVRLDEE